MISTASGTDGARTMIGWNRRSSAPSFSMCLRYSSSVVAPMHLDLAARERRLEHVRRVDGAFSRAGADRACAARRGRGSRSPTAGSPSSRPSGAPRTARGTSCPRPARPGRAARSRLPTQDVRHVVADDPLGEALDDRRLAHARLADEDGVVLRAARQDLDDALDLRLAPDHRVELAVTGELGQVAGELVQDRGLACASSAAGSTGRPRSASVSWRTSSSRAPRDSRIFAAIDWPSFITPSRRCSVPM